MAAVCTVATGLICSNRGIPGKCQATGLEVFQREQVIKSRIQMNSLNLLTLQEAILSLACRNEASEEVVFSLYQHCFSIFLHYAVECFDHIFTNTSYNCITRRFTP